MTLYKVNLTGQATVVRTQRIYADSPEEAEEKAVNYASMAADHEGWKLDEGQHVVDITAAAFKA
jgi:hypothetical protein